MSSPWCQFPATSPRKAPKRLAVRRPGRRRGRRRRRRSAAAAGRWASRQQRSGRAAVRGRLGATGVCFRFACSGCFVDRPGGDRLRRRRRRSPARSPPRSRSGSPSPPAARRAVRSGGRRARSRSRGSPACRRRPSSRRCPARASRGSPSRRARRGRSARRRPPSRAPSATEIVAPEKSPFAARPLVEPRAAPLTVSAVISPPKRLSDSTWLVALATPGDAGVARSRGADRAGADDRAVARVGEAGAEGGVVGRRRDRACLGARLAGHDHADRHRARRCARSRAGAAGASRPREQDEETSQRHEDREPLPHRLRIISKDGGL